MDINKWLAERCPESELVENPDGFLVLTIQTVETKLDSMLKHGVRWATRNYKSQFYQFDDQIYVSGSLELVLAGEMQKILVGCATFNVDYFAPNTHWDATLKSLAVVNAASDLGDQFGRFLGKENELREKVGKNGRQPVKTRPDAETRKKYARAAVENDHATIETLEALYDFKIG